MTVFIECDGIDCIGWSLGQVPIGRGVPLGLKLQIQQPLERKVVMEQHQSEKIGKVELDITHQNEMRLWTLHPRYLDAQGLVAAWREALLAQKVLRGETRGYRHHPQLIRFREQEDSLSAVALFLTSLADEAERRGYRFDRGKMGDCRTQVKISETRGQLLYEWGHLLDKLQVRSPQWYTRYRDVEIPDAHPLFHIIPGNIREWERRDS